MPIIITRSDGSTREIGNYGGESSQSVLLGEIANALWSISGKLSSIEDTLSDASNENVAIDALKNISRSLSSAEQNELSGEEDYDGELIRQLKIIAQYLYIQP
jgi:hypothetical protein